MCWAFLHFIHFSFADTVVKRHTERGRERERAKPRVGWVETSIPIVTGEQGKLDELLILGRGNLLSPARPTLCPESRSSRAAQQFICSPHHISHVAVRMICSTRAPWTECHICPAAWQSATSSQYVRYPSNQVHVHHFFYFDSILSPYTPIVLESECLVALMSIRHFNFVEREWRPTLTTKDQFWIKRPISTSKTHIC